MAKHKNEEGEVKFNNPRIQAAFESFLKAKEDAKPKLKSKRA